MAIEFDHRYLEYFACFNRQEYFEAHEVLEGLWLECRDERRNFYKGLIQVAAACLKLQQGKLDPAQRIAARAAGHLAGYPPRYENLTLLRVTSLLDEALCGRNPLAHQQIPRLELETAWS